MRRIAFAFALFAFFAAAYLSGCFGASAVPAEKYPPCSSLITGGGEAISLENVHTEAEIARGLSNRDRICNNCGMLFTFDEPARYQFWMKDMRFPLDIIFLDKDFRIVYVSQNAQPCPPQGECPLITPPSPIKYVLEMNAGSVAEHSLGPNSMLICVG